jgi:uncharacterized peroxidase-related enzyme
MQRYSLVEYDDANPDVRAVYDDFMRTTGSPFVPNWVKSTGHSERFAKAYWEKTRGCLVLGEMPLIFKELIIFVVSVENGSRYCTACHAHAALQLDKSLSYDDMLAMVGEVDSPNLPLATRVALKFARKMAREANEVTDADFAEMRNAGYSDDQIKEILSTIDLAMMFNCYTKGLQLPLDEEYRPIIGRN